MSSDIAEEEGRRQETEVRRQEAKIEKAAASILTPVS
jgi:hypothetical protein